MDRGIVAADNQDSLGVEIGIGEEEFLCTLFRVAYSVAGDIEHILLHTDKDRFPWNFMEFGLHAETLCQKCSELHVKTCECVAGIVICPGSPVAFSGDDESSPLLDCSKAVLSGTCGKQRYETYGKQYGNDYLLH